MSHIIYNKVSQIRDFINHPWQQQMLLSNNAIWNKVCSSMDVIEDTQMAIESFKNLNDFDAYDGGYLFVYGLLQAFFMQQDALKNLRQGLFNKKLDFPSEYPILHEIRELRNDAVGHPTNRGKDESFHYITQGSVNKAGFTLGSAIAKTGEMKFKDISLNETIKQQEIFSTEILDSTLDLLNNNWQKHKEQFMDDTLTSKISTNYSYMMSKVYEGLYQPYPLSEFNLDILFKNFEEMKIGISNRYGTLDAVDGIKHDIEKIEYMFIKLKAWLSENNFCQNKDAEVFVDCLNFSLKKFHALLGEIDKEFS